MARLTRQSFMKQAVDQLPLRPITVSRGGRDYELTESDQRDILHRMRKGASFDDAVEQFHQEKFKEPFRKEGQ